MLATHANTRYQQSYVRTVSREKLLIMLYDGAIGFARASKARYDAGDNVGFREYLIRCQAVVAEFLSTLDREAGGEVADNLAQLYMFLLDHLNEANLRVIGKNMDDVAGILLTLREGFDGAIRSLSSSRTAGGAM